MPRSYKHWTTKEDIQMINLRDQGKKYREIATILGRTTTSIERRYRKIIELKTYSNNA